MEYSDPGMDIIMNRLLFFILVLLGCITAKAANPSFQAFQTNQFDVDGNHVKLRGILTNQDVGTAITNIAPLVVTTNTMTVISSNYLASTPATNQITTVASNWANAKFHTNFSQTAVSAGSYMTFSGTHNGFLSGWGGSEPEFIFSDATDKVAYGSFGYDDVSNSGKAGQLNLRGRAGIPYGNLGGIHFNDLHLSGDNRGYVFRVKSVSGTNNDLGSFIWEGLRADPSAPDPGVDAGTYSSIRVADSYGSSYFGYLGGSTPDDPVTIPAWVAAMRRGKVVISGSPAGSAGLPALYVTNFNLGTNLLAVFAGEKPATNWTIINRYGEVGMGTNDSQGFQLNVNGNINVSGRIQADTSGSTGGFKFLNGSAIYSAGNGNISLLNHAASGFTSLFFGSLNGGTFPGMSFYSAPPAIRFVSANTSGTTNDATIFASNVMASASGHFSTANTAANMSWQDPATLVLTNRNSSGQIEVVAVVNDVHKGGFRVDQNAGFNWHGVSHVFWNATSTTAHAMTIINQKVGIGVTAGSTPKEMLEVVGGNIRITNGAYRAFSGSTPASTNNQAQMYSKTNLATTAAGMNVLDGSGAEYVLTAAVTNSFSGSSSLNFSNQTNGAYEDLAITVTGAADGDPVSIGVPTAAATGIIGSWSGYASNNTVFIRFVSAAANQNPGSGTFTALVHKIR